MKTMFVLLSICLLIGCAPANKDIPPPNTQETKKVTWDLAGLIYVIGSRELPSQLKTQFENAPTEQPRLLLSDIPTMLSSIPKAVGSLSIGCDEDSKEIPAQVIADILIFCGELEALQNETYSFEANIIIFKYSKIRFVNSNSHAFGNVSFKSLELIVEGPSEIISEGKENKDSRYYNSNITIDSAKFSGFGFLNVISKAGYRTSGY